MALTRTGKMREQTASQRAYQDYLDSQGGISKSTLSYAQWNESKKKKTLKRNKEYTSARTEVVSSELKDQGLSDAEIKKLRRK
jgi:hypothetical protein